MRWLESGDSFRSAGLVCLVERVMICIMTRPGLFALCSLKLK